MINDIEQAIRPKGLDPTNSPIPILENLKLNFNNPSFFQDYLIVLQLKRKRNEKNDDEDVYIIYEESMISRTTLLKNF